MAEYTSIFSLDGTREALDVDGATLPNDPQGFLPRPVVGEGLGSCGQAVLRAQQCPCGLPSPGMFPKGGPRNVPKASTPGYSRQCLLHN